MRKITDFAAGASNATRHATKLNAIKKTAKKSSPQIYKSRSIIRRLNSFALTQPAVHRPFYEFLEGQINEILIATPSRLLEIDIDIRREWLQVDSCLKNLEMLSNPLLENVFRYDLFRNGSATSSHLISWFNEINLRVCPYCNRNWITRIPKDINEHQLLFDIDHYFPKYKYPWFSLSYFNLIPSCTICNQRIKHGADLNIEFHLHPYMDDFDEIAKFHVPHETLDIFFKKDVEIELQIVPRYPRLATDPDFLRSKEYYDFFRLGDLYNTHLDYVRELLQKRIVYSKAYIDQLKVDYDGLFQSPDEIAIMVFGNYTLPQHIHERPLAKLTKDLLEDIL